jgi:hypothetical protein
MHGDNLLHSSNMILGGTVPAVGNGARRFLVIIDEERRLDRLEFLVARGCSSVAGLLGERANQMRTPGAKAFRASMILVACLTLVAVGSACGTAIPTPAGGQGAAPTPTYDPNEFNLTPVIPLPTKEPRSSPAPQPTSNPDDGVGVAIQGTYAPPPSPEQFAQWYGLIVSGTVIEVLPPQWSTADGKRPPGVTQRDVPYPYLILTPVIIKLDGAPLVDRLGADATSGEIVVATFGGQIGKDAFSIDDPSQHLELGQHLLLGLTDEPLVGGGGHVRYSTPAGMTWNVGMAYLLTDDGKALPRQTNVTPEQTVDAQAFIAAVVKAATNKP